MVDNDYPLGFKLSLHRKDLGIALGLADQLGAILPLAAMTRGARYRARSRMGHGDEDMSALARAIRQPRLRPRRGRSARIAWRRPQSSPTSSIGSPSLPS